MDEILEQLRKNVADTKAAFDATADAFDATADAVCAYADVVVDAAYDDWEGKRAALVKARLELNRYLKEQDND